MEQTRSKTPLILFAAAVLLSSVSVFFLVSKCKPETAAPTDTSTSTDTPTRPSDGDSITLTPNGTHVDETDTRLAATPKELVGRISELTIKANETGDIQPLINLLGAKNLSDIQTNHLRKLAATSKLKLNTSNPFSSVQGTKNTWSLNLSDRSRILLELEKKTDGKWKVAKIALPENDSQTPHPNTPKDPDQSHPAAITVHAFIDAITQLNPAEARKYIDHTQVSYAKLAGLCIIFEEGKYQLTKDKPLRKMFLRNTSAGWLARVTTPHKNTTAMFAINTKRKDANSPWKITEISLDKLLADYAQHLSDGDIHFTPLIKNPKGGDSLVTYFDLDSETLTPRTKRQLGIVANLLKSDANKKLTISGHTDALGPDHYNLTLSKKRAHTVMQFFTQNGVPAKQMKIIGFGKTKPRLPNQSTDGSDNPDGRRANRRAEILLDF